MILLRVILFLCIASVHCYELQNTLCDVSSCYFLYKAGNSYLTWSASREACKNAGLVMVKIESNRTQTVIRQLLTNLPQTTQRHVWIAGKRDSDETWRFMNGTMFTKQVSVNSVDNCMTAELCQGNIRAFTADNCDEKHGNLYLLCQYDPVSDSCHSLDSHYGNKCYEKTKYNGNEPNRTDWYNGQIYCSTRGIQGAIAYSYLDDESLISDIFKFVSSSATCVDLWLGVRRRIWFWQTDPTSVATRLPINYFNWYDWEEEESKSGDCIYIDRGTNGDKWRTRSCADSLQYFICMNASHEVDTGTGITTPTRDQSIGGHAIDATGKTQSTTSSSTKPIIAGAVVFVIVVAVSIGVTAFLLLKKRKERTENHKYVNGDFHMPSSKGTKNEDPEYDDINHADDVEDQYELTGSDQTGKTDIKHKEAPSGELYALSGKQVNKADVSKDEEDNALEALYAQPKKKGGKRPEAYDISAENEATSSGSDAETMAPSAGQTDSGNKRTEHFQAPSGEMYAKVITT